MNTKYIFITGGVVSGLGKGITAASLGRLLKNRGYTIINQKFDPYINAEPGKLNPVEHGEVFVTEDGAETDLDLGHYERFTDVNLNCNCSISSGKIYQNVLNKERNGDYLGKTIQVIPHVTNEIKDKIYSFDGKVDIVITELGGTVGDIEGLAFIEAIRQVGIEKNIDDVAYIHVTLLPYISGSFELKSKPTQHSVKELQSFGIKPDILVCRSDNDIPQNVKEKIALFCNVRAENVIPNLTADTLYAVPLLLEEQGLAKAVCKKLNLDKITPQNENWEILIQKIRNLEKEINIALVGKYTQLHDSYLSIAEALRHGGFANNTKVNISFIDSEEITADNVHEKLKKYNGILVPGGSGKRGIDGKITAISYARENNVPFLGICLGMQLAVIEFARNILGLKDADSIEFNSNSPIPVIHTTDTQKVVTEKILSMRLGAYPCKIKNDSLTYDIYQQEIIFERHRNKFEYNNEYKEKFENSGLICSGISLDDKNLVEIIELKDHPFFIGTQFHPEFKSRPDKPAPLFNAFINASLKQRD